LLIAELVTRCCGRQLARPTALPARCMPPAGHVLEVMTLAEETGGAGSLERTHLRCSQAADFLFETRTIQEFF
jgi:hypothetical protein